MKLSKAVAALLALAALALALRHDLADLARYQGERRLQAGDARGAESAFRKAGALGGEAAPLAYNLGVSLYRQGEFARAQAQFAAALATAAPELRVASLYNRGNCQFRQGERLAASAPEDARRFFREAIADYGQALALSPGAVDAGGNLGLARSRLASLGNEPAPAGDQRRAGKDARAAAPPKAAPARPAQRPDASASQGKTRRDLTRNEAERLLNEARGRERPAAMPHGGKRNAPAARPERDW